MVVEICTLFIAINVYLYLAFFGCGNLHFVYCWCLFVLSFMVVEICTLFIVDVHLYLDLWLWKFALCFLVVDICTLCIVDVHLHFIFWLWIFALCLLLMFICTLFYGCGHQFILFYGCVYVHLHTVLWLWIFALCFSFVDVDLHLIWWLWTFALCLLLMFICTLYGCEHFHFVYCCCSFALYFMVVDIWTLFLVDIHLHFVLWLWLLNFFLFDVKPAYMNYKLLFVGKIRMITASTCQLSTSCKTGTTEKGWTCRTRIVIELR